MSSPKSLPTLRARGAPLASPDAQRALLRSLPIAREFEDALGGPLRATRIDVMQINVGKLCNQTCRHCHVDAGPDRREVMSRETMQLCLDALARTDIPTVDITGGAPELTPHFRWLVEQVRALGRHVIDRCNLTILETPTHRDLPEFFAENRVEVVCSLPHYARLSTDRQRGDGVHERSIRALRRLNEVGYGDGRSGLRLVLVTNPVGAFLPGAQASLETEWKREMKQRHGVSFDALYTITNMPISRYLEWLESSGNLQRYLDALVAAFNPAAARGVMCRSTISIGWDGTLYDCDFNQMLEMPVHASAPRHVRDFDRGLLEARTIELDRHCFGCTAGAGSSCGGATT
ncbi:arsenosugar biosynthesis radical SAM (seleno)protein ArsS [Sandaracinus amylolyticus]|uniref:arsenosugar biosynthesis radical SAM (seleno)protein ArsS n=1 Tax=Sandaracinus amylolyticus TaxID=927083 RepID=UPI001EEF57F8|nr:arsenosugar biosynthesis radical SAM (seleno)protein ArsS [Sandaracinus amylolyticus]UJR80450.1 Cyclic pyranopterin monophosphate synthase [Sandaracinus amylolyticus]